MDLTRITGVATLSDAALERLSSDMDAETRIVADALSLACKRDDTMANEQLAAVARMPPHEIAHHARIASIRAAQGRQAGRTDLAARLFIAKATAVAAQFEVTRRAKRE